MSHVVLNATVYQMLCEAIMFVFNFILIDYLKKTQKKTKKNPLSSGYTRLHAKFGLFKKLFVCG